MPGSSTYPSMAYNFPKVEALEMSLPATANSTGQIALLFIRPDPQP